MASYSLPLAIWACSNSYERGRLSHISVDVPESRAQPDGAVDGDAAPLSDQIVAIVETLDHRVE